MSLSYRPLVYMWIAEYNDGSALPQFDPKTGRENLFRDVDHSKLKRFGWYPFSKELAEKILKSEGIVVVPAENSSFAIELEEGDKLVAKRENTVKLHTSGEVNRGETTYILGFENGRVIRIHENGSAEYADQS